MCACVYVHKRYSVTDTCVHYLSNGSNGRLLLNRWPSEANAAAQTLNTRPKRCSFALLSLSSVFWCTHTSAAATVQRLSAELPLFLSIQAFSSPTIGDWLGHFLTGWPTERPDLTFLRCACENSRNVSNPAAFPRQTKLSGILLTINGPLIVSQNWTMSPFLFRLSNDSWRTCYVDACLQKRLQPRVTHLLLRQTPPLERRAGSRRWCCSSSWRSGSGGISSALPKQEGTFEFLTLHCCCSSL